MDQDQPTNTDAQDDDLKREPIVGTYSAEITLRGDGTAPTIAHLEGAIEQAMRLVFGFTANVRAKHTDR